MKYKKISDEVLYTTNNLTELCYKDIQLLKEESLKNDSKKIRICAHPDVNDKLHEMIIVLSKDGYVKPHKHLYKTESFHLIEGKLDVVIFNEQGEVTTTKQLSDFLSGKPFYIRLPPDCFHTVVPKTETVVFHEITPGPFKPEDTVFNDWNS